jgi:hypothetical protein
MRPPPKNIPSGGFVVCKFFAGANADIGKCKHGPRCRFAHSETEVAAWNLSATAKKHPAVGKQPASSSPPNKVQHDAGGWGDDAAGGGGEWGEPSVAASSVAATVEASPVTANVGGLAGSVGMFFQMASQLEATGPQVHAPASNSLLTRGSIIGCGSFANACHIAVEVAGEELAAATDASRPIYSELSRQDRQREQQRLRRDDEREALRQQELAAKRSRQEDMRQLAAAKKKQTADEAKRRKQQVVHLFSSRRLDNDARDLCMEVLLTSHVS